MMRKFWVIFLSVLFTVLEVSLMPHFNLGIITLKFSLICAVAVAWLCDEKLGIINAAIIGSIIDVTSSKILCMYLVLYVATAVAVNYISKKADIRKVYICLISTFVISVLVELVGFFCAFFKYRAEFTTFALSKIILPQAFLNTLVCFVLFFIFRSVCPSEQ